MLIHIYNPRHIGCEDRRIMPQGLSRRKHNTLSKKINNKAKQKLGALLKW
jgi:hypothetical protein